MRANPFSLSFLSVVSLCLVLVMLHPGGSAAEIRLVIPGTGDSQFLLQILAEQFMALHPEVSVDIPDSIGSGGGIRGLLQKKFEVVRTARALKSDEQDPAIVEYPFAASLVVFATNPSVTNVESLTRHQILGIYTGAITQWDQVGGPPGRIYPLDREAGDSSRTVLERYLDGFKEMTSTAKVLYTTPDLVEALEEHRHTIGFLPMGLAREKQLNVLSLGNVAPNAENVENGTYPYVNIFYIVARTPVSGSAVQFIDFLHSSEATAIIEDRGVIPLGSRP
jgi:phosphate transport system substrate-binding protein